MARWESDSQLMSVRSVKRIAQSGEVAANDSPEAVVLSEK